MDLAIEADKIESCKFDASCTCLRCTNNRCGWASLFSTPKRGAMVVSPPAIIAPVLLVAHGYCLVDEWRLKLKTFSLPTVAKEGDLIHAFDLLKSLYESSSLRADVRLFTWTQDNEFASEIAKKMAATIGRVKENAIPLQQELDKSSVEVYNDMNVKSVREWINKATHSRCGNKCGVKLSLESSVYTAARFQGELKGDYCFESDLMGFTDINGKREHVHAAFLRSTEIIVEQLFISVRRDDDKISKSSIIRVTLPLVDGSRLAFVTPESRYLGRDDMQRAIEACSDQAFYKSDALRLHKGEAVMFCFPHETIATSVDVLGNFDIYLNEANICSSAAFNFGHLTASKLNDQLKRSEVLIELDQPFLFAHLSRKDVVLFCGQYIHPPFKDRLEFG